MHVPLLIDDFLARPALLYPDKLAVVDGEVRQSGGVELMMYRPEKILEELASFITLEDGDVIMTGTPAGVGPIHTGERFEATVRASGRALVQAAWVAPSP